MITTFSHRLWNSVSRLRKLPLSRSPYDQVPYTGSPLPIATSPVDVVSKPQVSSPRHDSQSADVQGSHRAFGDTEKLSASMQSFGRLLRRGRENGGTGTVFKSSQSFFGSNDNTRLTLALPNEHRDRSRSTIAEKHWQTSAARALFKRVPDAVANANGGCEFQHATVRGIMRSIQMVGTGSFVKAHCLGANTAGAISQKEVPAKCSPLPFMHLYSCHMPRMNNLGTHKSPNGRSLTERLVTPVPHASTWSPKFSVVSSILGSDSILHDAGHVTTPESSHSKTGREAGSQSGRSDEREFSAATSRNVSFRERLNRTATAIGATTPVARWITANTGLESSQSLSPSNFSADGSKPVKPVASTNVTQGRSRPGTHVIVPPPESEQSSRSDDPTPNDFEKKRAARINARPRRMLPRIR